MPDLFDLSDDLGPERIIHCHRPAVGLKAIVVIDNTAAGPAIGGTRMASDVSVEECARLARAMTLKNAAAGLPHGGAKSVIAADPAMPAQEKELLIRAAGVQWDGVEDARKDRNTAYIITAGLWGWSVIDTLWRNDGGGEISRYSFEWSPLSGAVVLRF